MERGSLSVMILLIERLREKERKGGEVKLRLEMSPFLKFRNCEPGFHERNQIFIRNWTNNCSTGQWSDYPKNRNHELHFLGNWLTSSCDGDDGGRKKRCKVKTEGGSNNIQLSVNCQKIVVDLLLMDFPMR